MKNRNTAPAGEFSDPFLQLMLERAIELAEDRRLLPIRINTAVQRVMAQPLAVTVAGDHGEGTVVSFQLDKNNLPFNLTYLQGALPAGGIEWPLRMTITAADGEIVAGILRERSTSIERRYFPENWSEPR